MLPTQKTEHYTLIFNSFVFMQVFNEINARKLGKKEYNIFHGFFNNFLFLGIIVATIIIQVLLVQYGGQPMRTAPLTNNEHILCIVIGLFSMVQGVIVKAILPVSWFEGLAFKETPMTDEEEKGSFTSTLRRSFRDQVRRQGSNSSIKDSSAKPAIN